jgi:hypothetical protein
VHSSFSTRGALCGFALSVSRALSCTPASARAVPPAASLQLHLAHCRALELQHARCVASHQLYLAHSRALELQHARGPLQLRFKCVSHALVRSSPLWLRISCISRTLVHSNFSTREALCSFASTVSRTLSCSRASARAVPSAASLQLYLAHYRSLELQHARCPLRLRIKCISRTPVHSSFSTRGALCGFTSTVPRVLSFARASARAVPA